MGELIVSRENELPVTMDDLSRFVLVGREKLAAVRAEIRAIEKVGLAQEVREQKLSEAQDISEAVLDAEVRIGELMAKVPKKQGFASAICDSGVANVETKQAVIERAGFTPKQVQRFETLAKHPEIVAQAKAEARENDDIVSRSLVLNMVKEKQRAEREAAREDERQENADKIEALATPLEAQGLFQTIVIDPPWDWGDEGDVNQFGRQSRTITQCRLKRSTVSLLGRLPMIPVICTCG